MEKTDWLEILDWDKTQLAELSALGYCYAKQGQYDTALKIFHALLVLESNNGYYLQALGAIYLEKGNALEALSYLDQSLRFEPAHLPTLLNRAKALLSLGYKKQGLQQARAIEHSASKIISSKAKALLLSYE